MFELYKWYNMNREYVCSRSLIASKNFTTFFDIVEKKHDNV